jgi:hypothetical protein
VRWDTGLEAAALVRRHFPAFWQAHVAQQRCTPDALLGVGSAYASLLNDAVALSDFAIDHLELAGLLRDNPCDALADPPIAGPHLGEDPWEALGEVLNAPDLMVYGLDIHAEDQEEFPALAVLLTTITGHGFVSEDTLDAALGADDEDGERWALLDALTLQAPRISCSPEALLQICAVLAHEPGANTQSLGALLAYAHQAVPDNPFANNGYFEMGDARYYGAWEPLWDGTTDLAIVARLQAEARALANAYGLLEAQVLARPALFLDIIVPPIVAAATALDCAVRWPGRDPDEDTHDHRTLAHPEAAALAAA